MSIRRTGFAGDHNLHRRARVLDRRRGRVASFILFWAIGLAGLGWEIRTELRGARVSYHRRQTSTRRATSPQPGGCRRLLLASLSTEDVISRLPEYLPTASFPWSAGPVMLSAAFRTAHPKPRFPLGISSRSIDPIGDPCADERDIGRARRAVPPPMGKPSGRGDKRW